MLKRYIFIFLILLFPTLSQAAIISVADISKHYENADLRLLIVPGHSNREWGTDFRGVKEGELNLELAYYLKEEIESGNSKIKVFVTRQQNGEFAPWLAEYMRYGQQKIAEYVRTKVQQNISSLENGQIKLVNGVYHNVASNETQRELYSINKFANDNRVDLVLHIHFNDHPGRKKSKPGKYDGFSIYIPERQFANHEGSAFFAQNISNAISKVVAVSNYPGEKAGVVEDQELIAIGANGTREGPSILVEYGYIYESQFHDARIRSEYLKELAHQTYAGISNALGTQIDKPLLVSTEIPKEWKALPVYGVRSTQAISLQRSLVRAGVYPPAGKTLRDCPVSGFFGSCTKKALESLRQKYPYQLSSASNRINPGAVIDIHNSYY